MDKILILTTLMCNVRDVLDIKVFVEAEVLIQFNSKFICKARMLYHKVYQEHLLKYLMACPEWRHGHYVTAASRTLHTQ